MGDIKANQVWQLGNEDLRLPSFVKKLGYSGVRAHTPGGGYNLVLTINPRLPLQVGIFLKKRRKVVLGSTPLSINLKQQWRPESNPKELFNSELAQGN